MVWDIAVGVYGDRWLEEKMRGYDWNGFHNVESL
jgi:hypothetical protein